LRGPMLVDDCVSLIMSPPKVYRLGGDYATPLRTIEAGIAWPGGAFTLVR
jgi:hypothetical protein